MTCHPDFAFSACEVTSEIQRMITGKAVTGLDVRQHCGFTVTAMCFAFSADPDDEAVG